MTAKNGTSERRNPLAPVALFVPVDQRKPVTEHYVRTADEVLRLAIAADMLGFGWAVHGYHCPTPDENVTQREYRITVWSSVMSETVPMLPEDDES